MKYTFRPLGPWLEGDTSPRRSSGVFKATWAATLKLLERELDFLDARNVVLQVDVDESQIRLDGMVRAGARPRHPGVRVAFDSKHGPLTYATDAYDSRYYGDLDGWQANVRAIALGLEALRAVDRYGVTKRGEQYTGWKALPSGSGALASGMTATDAQDVILRAAGVEPPPTGQRMNAGLLQAAVRKARIATHPDRHSGDRAQHNLVDNAAQVLDRAGWLPS